MSQNEWLHRELLLTRHDMKKIATIEDWVDVSDDDDDVKLVLTIKKELTESEEAATHPLIKVSKSKPVFE